MPTNLVIVLTTVSVETDADALLQTLVRERLAACASVLSPMKSVYTWQGKVEQAEERQVLMKTVAARVPALQKRLAELHPYDVPEFLVLDVSGGSEAYLNWVVESTAPRS
jgi:periplasmic divalent cation tolerance protein